MKTQTNLICGLKTFLQLNFHDDQCSVENLVSIAPWEVEAHAVDGFVWALLDPGDDGGSAKLVASTTKGITRSFCASVEGNEEQYNDTFSNLSVHHLPSLFVVYDFQLH